jgi:putative ABC transport system substrate-binding protein
MPVIGYLSGAAEISPFSAAFLQGLGEHGYVEGRNVEILYRFAKTQYDRLPAMAAELVGRRVAVIVATGGPNSALAEKKGATATIPIVFESGVDPVLSGLVPTLNHPGGNLTGVSFFSTALVAKRLELLHQIVPRATSIGYLVNPSLFNVEAQKNEAEIAARILSVRLVFLAANTLSEIKAAFAALIDQRIGALMADADPFLFAQRDQIAALAAHHAVPTIYAFRESVAVGGLVSYGASIADAYRLVGTYAGRILKGEKPADLPVFQPTKFELVINLATAKALGLTIPETLLATADEVIQ